MQLRLIVTALGALAAFSSAQQGVYSDIVSIREFVSHLNIDSVSQANISAILGSFNVGNIETDISERARLACSVGGVVFGPKLYSMSSASYGDLVDNNWSMTCWLTPQCVLQPESACDVSKAILISSFLGSQFAVRSGGHNPNVGFSNVGTEGILIDLSRLNVVSLQENGLASIGPGNRWGRVYKALSSQGRMAIGGRANDIGVGGLLLGGGLSYWSSIHGLASAKVVNYEVVLGNSSIINANSTSNKDLWWALKGGGANYGIVTRFDVETVEVEQIWFEGLLIDANQLEQLLRIAVNFAAIADNDTGISITYNLGSGGGAVYFAYSKPIERPEPLKAFYKLSHQTIINSTIGTWVDYHNAVSALNPFGSLRIAISTYDRKWDTPTLLDHYARFQNMSADVQRRLNATMYIAPQMFSKLAVAETSARGSPIVLSPENHCFLEVMITWTEASHDKEAAQALLSLGDDIIVSAQQFGTDLNFHFMNDAGPSQDVLGSYGTLDRMKVIRRAYDPNRVFQDLQHGGFLLERS